MDMMEALLETFRWKFNSRVLDDEQFKKHLEGKEKCVQIDIIDGPCFYLELRDCELGPVKEGKVDGPDILFSADLETFTGILKGEIKILRAYAKRQFKVKASFKDIGLLRKLIPKKDKKDKKDRDSGENDSPDGKTGS